MLTNFKRVFSFATSDFSRNIGRSLSAIFVLVITIMFFTAFFFLNGIGNYIISEVESKIDITASFKDEATEEDILAIKETITKDFPGVRSIEYVSRDEALAIFKEKHKDNQTFADALDQVGDNPFSPSLNITTTGDTAQYESIANALQADIYQDLVLKVDFSDKRATIDKVFSIIQTITIFGIALMMLLTLVVILVLFNTIKLAIDASKVEINTMTIVGASSWFVRAPFIIQGMLFGVVSFVFCFLVTGLVAFATYKGLVIILGGFNVWNFFVSNILMLVVIQLVFGVALGAISSYIVVQKYLKV